MIREFGAADLEAIYQVINDAAQAYKSIIPDHRWIEPSLVLADQR